VDASSVVAPPPSGRRSLHRFANPGRFLRLSGAVLPWLAAGGAVLTAVGLLWGLFFAPADWQQGDAVRIMYIHVPAAWLASAGYFGLALCSLFSLIWRHPLADLAAVEIGPVGAAFTALCLLTGSIWGRPMWGAWWVWDARLTSVLILFFLYLGHIALVRAFDDPQRGYRSGAILALIGVVNLPIIKFSVDWWNTLHQPATISFTGAPTMYVGMLWPLLLAALGYTPSMKEIERISPWRFAAPLSPDLAAQREDRKISFDALVDFSHAAIENASGALLVEGVGGVMVPLDGEHTVLDWMSALGVPVILVAGNYLGTISHTLTALHALASRDLRVLCVAVSDSEGTRAVSLEDNTGTIARFAGGIDVLSVPRLGRNSFRHPSFVELARLL